MVYVEAGCTEEFYLEGAGEFGGIGGYGRLPLVKGKVFGGLGTSRKEQDY